MGVGVELKPRIVVDNLYYLLYKTTNKHVSVMNGNAGSAVQQHMLKPLGMTYILIMWGFRKQV